MSSTILLHQLQFLEKQRKVGTAPSSVTYGQRKRRGREVDEARDDGDSLAGMLKMDDRSRTPQTTNQRGTQDPSATRAPTDDRAAKRFRAALEQLAGRDGTATRGRDRRRAGKRAPARADALLAAARRAATLQQADRTAANLRRLGRSDAAARGAKPDVKSVLTLADRRRRKNRAKRLKQWRLVREDKPRELAQW